MTASFSTLPVWKKNSTPAEWLGEMMALALEKPHRFARIVVVFEETNDKGLPVFNRQFFYGINHNTDAVGALQVAQYQLFEHMKGRPP